MRDTARLELVHDLVGRLHSLTMPAAGLRLLTYLAPSIPGEFFELVARTIEEKTGLPTALELETRVSGPAPDTDPFISGRADLAFVCGPSYSELKAAGSPVELLPAAPVFDDPRAAGRPVYFADLIVANGHQADSFEKLRGAAWAYNDRYSLSGWYRMLQHLQAIGHGGGPESFFSRLIHSGTHLQSIALVAAGIAEAASVDSNALRLELRRRPDLARRVRVVEAWGPSPIQPLLTRTTLIREVKARVLEALLGLHEDETRRRAISEFGVVRFVPVGEDAYQKVRI